MSKPWPRVRLGDVLKRVERFERRDDFTEYQFAGTYSYAKGVFVSERKTGISFGLPKVQRIKSGDFVYCKIMAWEGAFGVVPEEADNCVMSGAFAAYTPVTEKVIPKFLAYFFKLEQNWRSVGQQSTGTNVRRQSLHPSIFEQTRIPIPPIDEQRRIVARIDAVQQQLEQAATLRASIDHDIASLLAVRFQETLQHAEWLPMREVAPLVRREVTIHPEKMYSELGIRSFFKGAFARRTISGAEFTWQKLYEIKAGDLIFSNIMAWEKGIALAEAEHDGCVGNHRMLTCEAKAGRLHPAYLNYYFTTEEGFSKIYAASPGTAARNRTLTADSLMDIVVPCPAINQQNAFSLLRQKLRDVTIYRGDSQIENEALLKSLIQNVLALVN